MFLLTVILSVHMYINMDFFVENPFTRSYSFQSPALVAVDPEDNIYLVDDGLRRILKMDPEGIVSHVITGGSRKEKEFYRADDITTDIEGNLYVLNSVENLQDGYVEKQQVVRYLPNGKYDQVVMEFDRSRDERLRRDLFIASNISVRGNALYYFLLRKNTGTLYFKYDLQERIPRKIFTIGSLNKLIRFAQNKNQEIFLTKLDGKVYKTNMHGELAVIPLPYPEETLSMPWDVSCTKEGDVYISDIAQGTVIGVDKSGKEKIVYPRYQQSGKTKACEQFLFKSITVRSDGVIVAINEIDSALYFVSSEGKLKTKLTCGYCNSWDRLYGLLLWIEFAFFLVLIIYIPWFLYARILKRKISLILKQLFIFIPALVVSVCFVTFKIYDAIYNQYVHDLYNTMAGFAQVAATKFDPEAVARINNPSNYQDADYKKVLSTMHVLLNDNKDPWNALAYSRIIRLKDNMPYVCVDWSGFSGSYYPFVKARPMHMKALQDGTISYGRYSDIDTELYSAVAPIYNKEGKIVGIYEYMFNADIVDEVTIDFASNLVRGIFIVILFFSLIIAVLTFFLLSSISKLKRAVNRMAKGEFDTTVSINTRDEVEDLGRGFNIMSRYIQNYIEKIVNLNKAYVKFVPQEFLQFLQKDSIVNMKLGDQVQKEMTILFADIRSFTSLSEKMTPEENFNFLNSYLHRIGPAVRDKHGFIDKYIGDAIMALFPNKADDAIEAAIEIKERLAKYNAERAKHGYDPINNGIGIHTGNMIMGIIGEEERIEGTVISDSVNLASRLEGLTKMYGAGILISGKTMMKLIDPSKYHYRYLDRVTVRGKKIPVSIFEIYNGESLEIIELKDKTREDFENGVKLYYNKKLHEAREVFRKVYSANAKDFSAELYVRRCDNLIKYGIPDDWDGIEVLGVKEK